MIKKTKPEFAHGGIRPGAGRPPIKEGQTTRPVAIRLTEDQQAEYERLGGADWLRRYLDRSLGKAK